VFSSMAQSDGRQLQTSTYEHHTSLEPYELSVWNDRYMISYWKRRGSEDTEDEDVVQLSDDVKTQQDQDVIEKGQAVVTRSQSKPRVTKPLSVAEAIDTTISTESIAKLQAEDASLKKIWGKLQQKTGSEDSKETEFFVDKTLLYRHDPKQQQRGTRRSKAMQLVLPETLRLRVMKVAHESIMSGHQAIARLGSSDCTILVAWNDRRRSMILQVM